MSPPFWQSFRRFGNYAKLNVSIYVLTGSIKHIADFICKNRRISASLKQFRLRCGKRWASIRFVCRSTPTTSAVQEKFLCQP